MLQLPFKIFKIPELTPIQEATLQVIKGSLNLQVLSRVPGTDGLGTEPVMGSKFKVLAIEHRLSHLPAIHTRLLIVTLDLMRHTIQVDKSSYQLPQQRLLGLVFHHRDILPAGVTKDITKEGNRSQITCLFCRELDIVITPVVSRPLTRVRFYHPNRRF